MVSILESVLNEKRKWGIFTIDYFLIKNRIINCYESIASGLEKEESFTNLHYLKMQKDYIVLKMFYENITKRPCDEKLLKYYESVLIDHGFDLSKL